QGRITTGSTEDKERVEKTLEDSAYRLARAVVLYATDQENRTLANQYDLAISGWRRMRGETLIQRAGALASDAAGIAAGPDAALAAQYGIGAASATALETAIANYEASIAKPTDAIADRSAITATLPAKTREAGAKFAELEDLLPQFGGTPEGDLFLASYEAASQIIDAGHGPADDEEEDAEPDPAPEA
ncbi:MAG: hypothetical protein KDM63_21575, partial [Verrucomicrobiae bacterium]|nr:hypothetical protein [Verrucomicrobiae bacterium]